MKKTLSNLLNDYISKFEHTVVGTPAERAYSNYVEKMRAVLQVGNDVITEITIKLYPEFVAVTEKELAKWTG